jgi:dTDP-4-amino-4,6-dideoxygalactose transaminase
MAANAGGYAALAAINSGLKPKFVDVSENGLIDFNSLPTENEGVSAIVVTHLYGQLCDMQNLSNYSRLHDLRVVEDCAQSAGSSIDSLMAGSFGDISAFSFYPTKNLGGIGDGGAVCTSSKGLKENCLKLREYGWADRYYSEIPYGSNFRMDEIQALILNDQLSVLDHKNGIRRDIWRRYAEICGRFGVHILGNSSEGFAPHLAVLRVPNRNGFIDFMQSHGISTAVHYPHPDYRQPGIGTDPELNLEMTEVLCKEVVSIPLFPDMTESEIQKVERVLEDYLTHA